MPLQPTNEYKLVIRDVNRLKIPRNFQFGQVLLVYKLHLCEFSDVLLKAEGLELLCVENHQRHTEVRVIHYFAY